jgi:chromate transporter
MAQTDMQTGERADAPARHGPTGSWVEVLFVFLRLGLTSFGGPVAHLGYFRDEFVLRRRWLTDRAYADLVALCQFLPGPASSQVGMAVGLMRAGYPGLLAAWTAFTLPSAIILVAFAYGAGTLEAAAGTGWIQGLKAAAVAVVAHAVLGMAANLTPDKERATTAVLGMIGAMLIPSALGQVLVIVCGGLIGLAWLRPAVGPATEDDALAVAVRPRTALLFLAVFFALLLLLPLLAASTSNSTLRLIDGFYRAGSLVFGGGHVVLPLLQAEVVETGLVDREAFLAGYGATQAVPGPLFTFSAYLGAVLKTPPSGIAGASIALIAIFVPSALLIIGGLPFWARLRSAPLAQRALSGVNAAVVGLLAAALYNPVFTEGITSPLTMAIAAASFVALAAWKTPAWAVVIVAGIAGYLVL